MLAIHDQFSHQMRNHLKTSGMGLGLVRLLQDAKRFEEATTTFYLLENAVQGVESPDQKPSKANRLKGVSRNVLPTDLSARHESVQSTN